MVEALDVARLVALNGGQIVGKTRLQKSAYFLEALQVGLGIDFSYYRFGPFSEELSNLTDDAIALKMLDIDWKLSQAGTQYAVFSSSSACSHIPTQDFDDRRREILDLLKRYSAIELELAATANFLKFNGYSEDPWTETQRRKATKAAPEKVKNSQKLLGELEAFKPKSAV